MAMIFYARTGDESSGFRSFLDSLPIEVVRLDEAPSVAATVTVYGTVMGETKHYMVPRNRGQRLIATGDSNYDYILSGQVLPVTEALLSTKSIRSELPIFMVGWIEMLTRLPQLLSSAESILLVLDEGLLFLSDPRRNYREHQYQMLKAIFESFFAPASISAFTAFLLAPLAVKAFFRERIGSRVWDEIR
jgi:hypothetical protein